MRYCLMILSALLLVSSCTKMEDTKSREQILRDNGPWALESGTIQSIIKKDFVNSQEDVNKTENIVIKECALDDQLIFRDANNGAHIPGEALCSVNETAEVEFRWGLSNDDKDMFIYDGKEFFGFDVNANIIEFYNDKFGIRFSQYTDKYVDPGTSQGYWTRDTTIYTMYFIKYVPPAEGQ